MKQTPTVSPIRSIISVALLVASLMISAGCDNPTTETTAQQVDEIAWLPNQEMLALVNRITTSSTSGLTTVAYDLVHVGSDGTIGNRIPLSERTEPGLVPTLVVSSDGTNAITQVGSTVFRVNVPAASSTALLHGNLLAVSRDLHYVLVTGSNAAASIKDCAVYDVSTTVPRQVSQFFVSAASNSHALWLDAGRFAMTIFDSGIYSHVNIYDTLAHVLDVIPNAEVALHASAFAPRSQEIFFRNSSSYIGSYNLLTQTRSSVRSQRVSSFDVSPDGQLAVYVIENDSDLALSKLRALNVETTATSELATGALAAILSPDASRVAYTHFAGDITADIHVTSVVKP